MWCGLQGLAVMCSAVAWPLDWWLHQEGMGVWWADKEKSQTMERSEALVLKINSGQESYDYGVRQGWWAKIP